MMKTSPRSRVNPRKAFANVKHLSIIFRLNAAPSTSRGTPREIALIQMQPQKHLFQILRNWKKLSLQQIPGCLVAFAGPLTSKRKAIFFSVLTLSLGSLGILLSRTRDDIRLTKNDSLIFPILGADLVGRTNGILRQQSVARSSWPGKLMLITTLGWHISSWRVFQVPFCSDDADTRFRGLGIYRLALFRLRIYCRSRASECESLPSDSSQSCLNFILLDDNDFQNISTVDYRNRSN